MRCAGRTQLDQVLRHILSIHIYTESYSSSTRGDLPPGIRCMPSVMMMGLVMVVDFHNVFRVLLVLMAFVEEVTYGGVFTEFRFKCKIPSE